MRFCVRRMRLGRDQHPAARLEVRQRQSARWLLEELYSMLTHVIVVCSREAAGPVLSFLHGDSSGAG